MVRVGTVLTIPAGLTVAVASVRIVAAQPGRARGICRVAATARRPAAVAARVTVAIGSRVTRFSVALLVVARPAVSAILARFRVAPLLAITARLRVTALVAIAACAIATLAVIAQRVGIAALVAIAVLIAVAFCTAVVVGLPVPG